MTPRHGEFSIRGRLPSTVYCLLLLLALLGLAGAALAQAQGDVIGMHDLSPGGMGSPIKGSLGGSCLYCHAPHSGLNGAAGLAQTPLWDQKLSNVQSYKLYSGTMTNTTVPALPLGSNSTLCLSCHDGTVAVGTLVPYGKVSMAGQMYSTDVYGTDLSTMHPINFTLPLKAAPDLYKSLTANPPSTDDTTGAVHLFKGNVQCGSCHNPHVQNVAWKTTTNTDFLVIDNSAPNSPLCTACHVTTPTGGSGMGLDSTQVSHNATIAAGSQLTARAAVSNTNPLAGWTTSIHSTATNRVAPQISLPASSGIANRATTKSTQVSLGSYDTVARNGCSSCHAMHNAQGQNSLLRAVDDQTCLVCHNGSSNISPAIPNVLAEMVAPKYGHAFSVGNTPHLPNEAVLLNQNMHVTCADCHNAHAPNRVGTFPAAPAIRPSQAMIAGISATDGKTVLNPAVNQYENCLRCHGTSTGKKTSLSFGYLPLRAVSASDPLNVIPEFSALATSSHPVFHDRTSPYPQPSLRANMLNLDGRTLGRSMGTRILCTDCHNSDDNREFGGTGPSGPHGSIFAHILERQYQFSQAPLPGKLITNLFPNPNLSAEGGLIGGPYALCAKCHDFTQIVNNTSFSEHARHIKDGFSCSVCHTAHGMGAQSGTISGERLVNFDIRVVASNGATPISYNRATNSCSLVCHNYAHQLRTAGAAARR
ncbi:MAG: cytochrome c3 family protein [Terriglobia bacterium]